MSLIINPLQDIEVNMLDLRHFDSKQHNKWFAIVALFSFDIVEYIQMNLAQCTRVP